MPLASPYSSAPALSSQCNLKILFSVCPLQDGQQRELCVAKSERTQSECAKRSIPTTKLRKKADLMAALLAHVLQAEKEAKSSEKKAENSPAADAPAACTRHPRSDRGEATGGIGKARRAQGRRRSE